MRTLQKRNPSQSQSDNFTTTTMKVSLLFFLLPTACCAFQATIVPAARPSWTKLRAFPERFERAVECSRKYELCAVDELTDLADELESYQGSFFETDETLRAKEVQDREDLADVLRKQAELKLRQDYLENANLFLHDVEEAAIIKHRDEYLELLDEVSDT